MRSALAANLMTDVAPQVASFNQGAVSSPKCNTLVNELELRVDERD
jgi:hypothetical protein